MAKNVIGQVVGGTKKVFDDVDTVADVRAKLGIGSAYKGSINGDPAEDSDDVDEGNYVSFAEAVKGA